MDYYMYNTDRTRTCPLPGQYYAQGHVNGAHAPGPIGVPPSHSPPYPAHGGEHLVLLIFFEECALIRRSTYSPSVQMGKAEPLDLPAVVYKAAEYKQRMRGGCAGTHLPVFEGPRRAVAVVDVARSWGGKPQQITSVPEKCATRSNADANPRSFRPHLTDHSPQPPFEPHRANTPAVTFKIGERAGSASQPVVCFKTVKAACRAKFLQTTPSPTDVTSRPTQRMIMLFEVGYAGEGKESFAAEAGSKLRCSCVLPVALQPMPDGSDAELAQPRKSFWVPGGAIHALG
jgi:hypothetical protein